MDMIDGLEVGGLLTYKYGGYLHRHTAGRCKRQGVDWQAAAYKGQEKAFAEKTESGVGVPCPPYIDVPPAEYNNYLEDGYEDKQRN